MVRAPTLELDNSDVISGSNVVIMFTVHIIMMGSRDGNGFSRLYCPRLLNDRGSERRSQLGAMCRRIRVHSVSIHSSIYMQIQVIIISYNIHIETRGREQSELLVDMSFWPIIQIYV